jgi:lysophospholipase L1-like esterase
MQRPSAERAIGVGLAVGGVALVAVLLIGFGSELLGGGRTANPSASFVAQASPSATQTDSATPTSLPSDSPSPAPTAVTTPTAAPATALPLPAILGAIGDSYTQAWSVSPSYKRDHPGYSWAVGTVKGDGVFSLRERFEALGDKLTVIDAATSGRKMSDAARQASVIVTAARKLTPGATAYVAIELGTNDLCDNPTTAPDIFEAQLRSAVATLRSGLPAGSRILMLSIPDFSHFRDITQADAKAKATLNLRANSTTCAPFLGSNSPLTIQDAQQILALYNATLARVCDEIEATDGPSNKLHCRHNEALLSEKDFKIKDLSTVDYFHPSLSGQARMAAAAWKAGYWANVPLPSGAAALAPGGTGVSTMLGFAPVMPMLIGGPSVRRPRRRMAHRADAPRRG